MGLSSYSLVWHKLAMIFDIPVEISEILAYLTLGLYLCLSLLYLVKISLYPAAFQKKTGDLACIGYFGTASVATLLTATAFFSINPMVSMVLWAIAVITEFVLMLRMVSLWIADQDIKMEATTLSWFIPVVGCLLIPVVGVEIASEEISWFFFSTGLVFWLILMPIFFNRAIYHHTLEEKMLPTLFILMAPPSTGMLGWYALTGEIDAFGKILYSISLFMFFVVVSQYKRYWQLDMFYLSWWMFSFPLAVSILATFAMVQVYESYFLLALGIIEFVILTVVIFMLVLKTIKGLVKGEIILETSVVRGKGM